MGSRSTGKTSTTYFPDQQIQQDWTDLVKKLDAFEETVTDLNDRFRGATKQSRELDKAVESADQTIDQIEHDLKAFSHRLNDFIDHEET